MVVYRAVIGIKRPWVRQVSEGVEGKTIVEMNQQTTYIGWDFENTWKIIESQTYPYFLWQGYPIEGEEFPEGTVNGAQEGTIEDTVDGCADGAQEGQNEGEGESGRCGGCGCSISNDMTSFDEFMKYLLDILFVGLFVSLMSGMKRPL